MITKDDVIEKLARAIQTTINEADRFERSHGTEPPACILPHGLRARLGDALDSLADMEDEAQNQPPPQSPARDEGAMVSAAEGFDIYKGMLGRDFTFRGCDQFKGAMFEHTCGWAVRIGPKSAIESIAEAIERHDCERDKDE